MVSPQWLCEANFVAQEKQVVNFAVVASLMLAADGEATQALADGQQRNRLNKVCKSSIEEQKRNGELQAGSGCAFRLPADGHFKEA